MQYRRGHRSNPGRRNNKCRWRKRSCRRRQRGRWHNNSNNGSGIVRHFCRKFGTPRRNSMLRWLQLQLSRLEKQWSRGRKRNMGSSNQCIRGLRMTSLQGCPHLGDPAGGQLRIVYIIYCGNALLLRQQFIARFCCAPRSIRGIH
jgi:hypothetical protein